MSVLGWIDNLIFRTSTLQLSDDRTIAAEELTTGLFADSLYIEPDDNNVTYFALYPSATGVEPIFKVVSSDSDSDFGIQAKGNGVIDLKSNTEINSQGLKVKFVDAGAVGAQFTLEQESSSPAVNDVIANIFFNGYNDAAAKLTYGDIQAQIKDNANGAEHGSVFVRAITTGALEIFCEADGAADEFKIYKILNAQNAVNMYAGSRTFDNQEFQLGTGGDFRMDFSTAQTVSSAIFAVDGVSRTLILCESADRNIDFGHSAYSDPTFVLQGADAGSPTERMRLFYNSTDNTGTIASDVGGISLIPATGEYVDVYGKIAVIQESDDDVGAVFEILKDTASPATNDNIGDINWISQDSIANDTTYSKISVDILDPTDGTEDGNMSLKVMENGSLNTFINLTGEHSEILLDRTTFINGKVSALTGNIESYFNDNGAGGALVNLMHETASPAVDDDIGELRFTSKSDTGAQVPYAAIIGIIADPTNAAEHGLVEHVVMENGSEVTYLTLDGENASITLAKESIFSGSVQLDAGVMFTQETTTPTPIANYGAWYTKTDNIPYFQDGAGVEHELSEVGSEFASMYLNANGTATTIETANTPIALRLFTTGSLDDWTFVAGSTAAITAYADYSGTVAGTVLATSTHGLTTGDYITIRGTTNYNGVFQVTVVDGTHFYFIDTWAGDDGASDFDQASYLQAGANSAGTYSIDWNVSTSEGGGAGSTILYIPYKNTTVIAQARSQRKFANNDVGSISGGGDVGIVANDRVYLTAQSTGTNAITNSYGSVRLHRL